MTDNNFLSIDRLVEFGLGVSVAQQMVASMNRAMTHSHMPGLQTPLVQTAPHVYHAVLDGNVAGPFNEGELMRLITDRRLTIGSKVWRPGLADWRPVQDVPDVLRLVALCPPPLTTED